jgi:hypothetical protein
VLLSDGMVREYSYLEIEVGLQRRLFSLPNGTKCAKKNREGRRCLSLWEKSKLNHLEHLALATTPCNMWSAVSLRSTCRSKTAELLKYLDSSRLGVLTTITTRKSRSSKHYKFAIVSDSKSNYSLSQVTIFTLDFTLDLQVSSCNQSS